MRSTMAILKSPHMVERWLWVLALAIGVGVVVNAQTRQPPGQSAVSEQDDTAAQTPIYRAGITLVTTDVIVRDANGTFIPDLAPEDFIVKEDDVLQEVVSLVLVHGGRVFNQLAPPPPVREGIILPATRRANDTAGRIIIIFVDDLHLQTSYTPKVKQVFRTIADTLIHEGDLFGIISTGPSSLSIELTYDRSILRDAEDKIMGDGFSPRELIQTMGSGPRGPTELRFRNHVAMKTARETVRNLELVQDRRKVFIYLSSGYDFNPFALERIYGGGAIGGRFRDMRQWNKSMPFDGEVQDPLTDPFEMNARAGHVFADTDLSQEIAELSKAANRANTSFYTIDPRGLIAGADIDFDVRAEDWNEYVFKTQNSLRMLAELTGGEAIVNRNDFEDALQEIDAETSDYYVIGYYTNNPDPTKRTRLLDIEVNRDDADVKARTSYTFARQVSASLQ